MMGDQGLHSSRFVALLLMPLLLQQASAFEAPAHEAISMTALSGTTRTNKGVAAFLSPIT